MIPTPQLLRCPRCSALCWAGEARCPACGHVPAPAAAISAAPGFRFGLGSIMMGIALVAVILGAFRLAPGVGILLLALGTPALIRTSLIAGRRRERGRPLSTEELLGVAIISAGVVILIGFAMVVSFSATCTAGLFAFEAVGGIYLGFMISILVGLAAGTFVLFRLGRQFWPHKDRA